MRDAAAAWVATTAAPTPAPPDEVVTGTVVSVAEWPLVGRSGELARALAAVAEQQGVVLVGEAGVGKTRLARDVRAALDDRGWSTYWFAAGSGAAAVPFAPFAGLLDEEERELVDRLLRVRRTIVGDQQRPTLVVVDDAHLLDDVSVGFVRGLLVDTDVRVLLTVRTGSTAAPVWTDVLERQELDRLSREAVDELVPAILGAPVDPNVTRWVWTVTDGNPLFVRELLVDAVERGALIERNGRMVLVGDSSETGGRVQEVIAARIGALDDDERTAVELVALSEPIGLAFIASLVGDAPLQALECRGLLRTDAHDRRLEVRLAHPLHTEVTRSMLGRVTATMHRRRLLDALLATGSNRADDRLQLALWRMENGDVSDWRGLLDAAHTLSRASEGFYHPAFTPQPRVSIAGSDSRELAIRLARAALVASGEAEAAVLLAYLLLRIGRANEAKVVVDAMTDLARNDRDRVMVAKTQCDFAMMFSEPADEPLGRLAAIEATVDDPSLQLHARASRAATMALLGQTAEALDLGHSVVRDQRADADDRLVSAGIAAGLMGTTGRSTEGYALLDEASALAAHGESKGLAAIMISRIMLLALDGRLDEMRQLCSFSVAVADQVGSEDGVAVFSSIAAQGAVGSGRLLTALRLADDALRRMVDIDPVGTRVLALTARAQALGYLGRAEHAALAFDDLLLEPRLGLFTTGMHRAHAWTQFAAGRIGNARRVIAGAVDEAEASGALAHAVAASHDALRLGGDLDLARVTALTDAVDGPYAPLVRAHAEGMAKGDPALVEHAARGHESMGADLYAAECWGHAAGLHRRAGRRVDANEAAGASRVALARCEGPPVTPPLVDSEPLGSLTKREAEVVALAADGLSDREIADRLVLSVRTVESHLRNAYAKLGVEGRDGLKRY